MSQRIDCLHRLEQDDLSGFLCSVPKLAGSTCEWRLPLLVRGVAGAPFSAAAFVLGHLAVQFDAQDDSFLPLPRLESRILC
jgi:hypothetical protein